MTDSELIWKFLSGEFQDTHPVVYLYACGNIHSPKTAIDKAMGITKKIFNPCITDPYLLSVIKGYLDHKKKQYIKGEIKIIPLY